MKIAKVTLRREKVLLDNSNSSVYSTASFIGIVARNADGDRVHVQLSIREIEELHRAIPDHKRKSFVYS